MKIVTDKCMACMVAMITGVVVADLPRLDSSRFDYKYDMIVLPSAQNLDNDAGLRARSGRDLEPRLDRVTG